jgi:predicted nuclease with TOPRIM domain
MLGVAAAALVAFSGGPAAQAQSVDASATVGDHGNWTLKQREDWLYDRLERARDDGSLAHPEYDRVRHELSRIRDEEDRLRDNHDAHQLTDNETADLEARLDGVANQIHWLHEESFQKPW